MESRERVAQFDLIITPHLTRAYNLARLLLPEDAQRRMTDACGASLAELQQAAHDAGCML